jgi:hypothetical protein
MTRGNLDYSARRAPVQAEGFDADVPVAGFYRTKLRRDAVPVGVRIWFGPPKDPVTGEELDRSPRWQAEANGRYIDLQRVWPGCADEPIDEREHGYLCGLQAWGEAHAPNSPQANPNQPVDLLTAPLPF